MYTSTEKDSEKEIKVWIPSMENKNEHKRIIINASTEEDPEREIDGEDGIIARDRNPKEDIEAFKRATEMWQRAGEIAKRMTADMRRKEHMMDRDCKSKTTRKMRAKRRNI